MYFFPALAAEVFGLVLMTGHIIIVMESPDWLNIETVLAKFFIIVFVAPQ